MVNSTHTLALVVPLLLAVACKKSDTAPTPQPAPNEHASANPAQPPAQPSAAPTPGAAPEAPQPRVERNTEEYSLVASLNNGAFDLALRGVGEYHVNENYPTSITLTVENGSVATPVMRRADAAEHSQTLAHFTQPVQSSGASTVVRGNMRFGMCRADRCSFYNQEFALVAQ